MDLYVKPQATGLLHFTTSIILPFLCSAQKVEDKEAPVNRKEFFLLDQDYYHNLHQNESGIILKVGNTLFHPDTERYLTAKLRHLLLYGMKRMALNANYTNDRLDNFYLANRKQVKQKMCEIFLKLYNDFTFKGIAETKKFIQLRTFSGGDYNAMRNHKEVHNFWRLDTEFDEKTDNIRRELRKTLTNMLIYFERCYFYHYYRQKNLALQAYRWNHHFEDDEDMNYFQFQNLQYN